MGLLKLWPVTNTAKEVLFLTELEEVMFHFFLPFCRYFAGIAMCVVVAGFHPPGSIQKNHVSSLPPACKLYPITPLSGV